MAQAAGAPSAFVVAGAPRRVRSNTIFVFLAVASVALLNAANSAFSMAVAPRRIVSRAQPQGGAQVADDVEAEDLNEKREKKPKKNATTPLLKLGDDFLTTENLPVAQGPQWATCFVEAQEAGRISSHGVAAARRTLEEWVVRGERDRVKEFQAWRTMRSSDASVRCVPKSAEAAEDSFCLECISHSGVGAFPFTPLGHVTTTSSGAIMTFSGLHECLASTAGTGYCKTGTVAMAE